MSKHSILGGSTVERWWNCPGSAKLIAALPPIKANKYMAEGTVAHTCCEMILKGRLSDGDPAIYMPIEGQLVSKDGHKIEITKEMVDSASEYVDYIFENMEKFAVSKKSVHVESPIVIDKDLELFGTPDHFMYNFTSLFVTDFKYGAGTFVSAFENKQLLYYAVGALMNVQRPIDEITISIFQPRCPGSGLSEYKITRADLEKFKIELIERAKLALTDNAPLNAGPWCIKNFCPLRSTCPAYKNMETEESNGFLREAEEFAKTQEAATKIEVIPPNQLAKLQAYSPVEIAKMYRAIPMFKDMIKRIEEMAEDLAGRNELPGYKQVETEGRRKWIDPKTVETNGVLNKLAIYETKLKSPNQIEILIKEFNKKPENEENKIDISIVSNLTEKPKTGVTIVESDDKRKSVHDNVEETFARLGYASKI